MSNMLNSIEAITAALKNDPAALIDSGEKHYHGELQSVVDEILKSDQHTVVAIAGPSGSGKTTSAKLICKALSRHAIHGETISLDDFFLGASRSPVDENGKQDYESINALDLEELHRCFHALHTTGACDLPVFDFNTGERALRTRRIALDANDVVIIEGLHAINPALVDALEYDRIIKLFVNVDTRVVDEDGNLIFSRRDLRLMRRASRDLVYRNSTLANTLRMWPDVVEGEIVNLFPYKETADRIINTFHPYEPAVFKKRIESCIATLDPAHPGAHYMERIGRSLRLLPVLDESDIPETSLLREFM